MAHALIAGNWKMNGDPTMAESFAQDLRGLMSGGAGESELLLCPPFPLIPTLKAAVEGMNVKLGAQDCHFEASGAHTGDVSPELLAALEASIDTTGSAAELFERVCERVRSALGFEDAFRLDVPAGEEPLQAAPGASTGTVRVAHAGEPPALAGGRAVHGWVRLAAGPQGLTGLAWTAAPGARTLLSAEHRFLERLAERLARRLQALARDDERRRASELQRSLVEAELKALRAHVDPHFLFNTLNTIAELIQSDPDRAERMTERLSATFRHALSTYGRSSIPLAEEVRFLEQFLAIERVRFGERLRVQFAIDPRLADEPIPPLLLQPLVENSMRHGLAPKREGGELTVSAEPTEAGFQIRVEDDGVGFDPTAPAAPSGAGFGFESTRRRVDAFFGSGSRVEVDSAPGRGTRVRLELRRAS